MLHAHLRQTLTVTFLSREPGKARKTMMLENAARFSGSGICMLHFEHKQHSLNCEDQRGDGSRIRSTG